MRLYRAEGKGLVGCVLRELSLDAGEEQQRLKTEPSSQSRMIKFGQVSQKSCE